MNCWGSSHGWILTHGIDDNMYLFNPLTKDRLDLPCRRTIPFLWDNSGEFLGAYFINRAVVLKVSGDTLLVVLIYDAYLRAAIAKPGDTQWTPIISEKRAIYRRVMDVLYRRDNLGTDGLVFVNESGNIALVNLDDVQNKKPLALSWYGCYVPYIQTYIVNSGQDLLLVLRIFETETNDEGKVREGEHDIDHYKTVNFKVYKFQFDDRSWEELKDLQDVALFVGNNATMSVRASEMGCQRNCIYFTDTYTFGSNATKDKLAGHDFCVFQMGDNIIRPLKLENNTHLRSSYCCPMCFRPAI
ncbi:putative F-box protein At5g60060 [Chenopodium quinoa]|uniref:putative F-box protein At5g60060 n=1 Tax=Chenopodium quinoa TaxID=63459 RepID=UPI000B78FDF6|nr:putative F-box protein At5g60060 [Chenopodium quinoa]